jgi:hypothetical protein
MAVKGSRKAKGGRPTPAEVKHPHSVANIVEEELEATPDQPFAEGVQDAIDPDLRHRMISEAAYHRYAERGYEDGYDLDDWLQAEAEVDHVLLRRQAGVAPG